MPIKPEKQKEWEEYQTKNSDSYGKACVNVARRAMELLDEGVPMDSHKLICRADKESKAGGITGFMAGCVAQMISAFHSRGEEFRKHWNLDTQINVEGQQANDSGGVLNPALLTVEINK